MHLYVCVEYMSVLACTCLWLSVGITVTSGHYVNVVDVISKFTEYMFVDCRPLLNLLLLKLRVLIRTFLLLAAVAASMLVGRLLRIDCVQP